MSHNYVKIKDKIMKKVDFKPLGPKNGDVVGIRTAFGEFMGTYAGSENDYYMFKDIVGVNLERKSETAVVPVPYPITILASFMDSTHNPTGSIGMDVELQRNHVFFLFELQTELVNVYKTVTSTIAIVSPSGIDLKAH